MSSHYEELLEATIRHLRALKARGESSIDVSPEILRALTGSPPPARPTRSPTLASSLASTAAARPAPPPTPPTPPTAAPVPINHAVMNEGETGAAPLPPSSPSKPVTASAILSLEAKVQAMAELRERALVCMKCPNLASARKNVVFGVGDPGAQLMFVGEAPGADEDLQGEPFVGAAGQLLTRIIQTMGLSRQSVYIANILKCRPDTPGQSSGNRKPTTDEMNTCIPYLHAQIDLIRPKVLVALGGTALEGLLGLNGITKLRGVWREYRGIPLMPTFHPSFLLRNQSLGEKRKVWEDMLAVMEKLSMPVSEKQRKYFTS